MIKRTITTTLPTTLAEGEEVYYRDANGVQTLWVGNASGEAWPSVGYKEYVALVSYLNPTLTVSVRKNDIGSVVWSRDSTGTFQGSLVGAFINNDWGSLNRYIYFKLQDQDGETQYVSLVAGDNLITVSNFIDDNLSDSEMTEIPISIRIYP